MPPEGNVSIRRMCNYTAKQKLEYDIYEDPIEISHKGWKVKLKIGFAVSFKAGKEISNEPFSGLIGLRYNPLLGMTF